MIEYTVVFAVSTLGLSDQVNSYITSGWMVTGGVAVFGAPMYAGFYQAMIKITPENLENDPNGP